MKPQLKVLSGVNAGTVGVFSKPLVTIGRHPTSDLRLDPDRELDVSARHATVVRKAEQWYVRDLGSRNGTLVNGHKIIRDTKLDDTDQIRLGAGGPTLEFRLVPDSTPDTVTPPPATGGPVTLRPSVESAPRRSRPAGTTQRIRAEVRRQTRGLRKVIGALVGVLVIAVGAFLFLSRQQEQRRERQAQLMQARIDSVLAAADAAIESLKGQLAGLADALRRSQSDVQRLSGDLASARASGNTQQVEELRARLDTAAQTLRNQQLAAQVDYSAIHQANQDAVAIIFVEFGPREVFTGTAFAITSNGVMITNRHVVAGADGTRRPTRIGIRFADSDQTFAARLLAVSPDPNADVAVVKVDIQGGNPAVQPIDPQVAVRTGDPVAVIGYPLGVELPSDWRGGKQVARASLTAGTVSKVLSDLVQVDGYGAEGSSGSPIFDREGHVVSVLYGGQPGTGGRIVFSVPIGAVMRLAAPYISQR